MTSGLSILGDKLNAKATDKERVKFCLFIIHNAFRHLHNHKATIAGCFANGYLGSLLIRHNLNSWD